MMRRSLLIPFALALATPGIAQAQTNCQMLKYIVLQSTLEPAFADITTGDSPNLQGTEIPRGLAKCSVVIARNEALTGHSYTCVSDSGIAKPLLLQRLAELNAEVAKCLKLSGAPPRALGKRGDSQTDYAMDFGGHRLTISVFTYDAEKPQGGTLLLMFVRKPLTP